VLPGTERGSRPRVRDGRHRDLAGRWRIYGIRGETGHEGCNGFRSAAIQASSQCAEGRSITWI